MKKRRIEWILGEIPQLNKDGVIDTAAADRLKKHYTPMLANSADSAASVAMILFSCLGALLIGGGIILIFAHNWSELSRPVRAAISISMPIVALLISFYVIAKDKSRLWREGAGVFLFVSAVSCLALISQTYYLGGSMKAFLFAVLIMTFPVPAMLRSMGSIILYLTAIVGWYIVGWYMGAVEIRYGFVIFDRIMFFVFPALSSVYFLLTYSGKSRMEKIVDSYIITIFLAFAFPLAFAFYNAESTPLTFFASAAVMFALGRVAKRSEKGLLPFARPFILLGFIVIIFTAISLQITETYEFVLGVEFHVADLVLAIVALMVAVFGFYKRLIFESLLCCLPLICFVFGFLVNIAAANMIFISLAIAAVSVGGFVQGVKRFSLGTVNIACVLFLSAVLVRFFDGEFSTLARGISFIICGIIFFLVNIVMIRLRKGQREELANA